MVGLTYANDRGEWAGYCTVHNDWEMFHTCAGGEGEPLGYCESWDGTYAEGPKNFGSRSNCVFTRPYYEED